jgi:hypothetical protein
MTFMFVLKTEWTAQIAQVGKDVHVTGRQHQFRRVEDPLGHLLMPRVDDYIFIAHLSPATHEFRIALENTGFDYSSLLFLRPATHP